jgi:predicted nucleotidyltransferase
MPNPSAPQSALRYPLNDILGSRAGVRVLRELCAHGGELGVAHLAITARLTRQGVRNALGELLTSHIVESVGSGRTVLHRLNRGHPLASVLETLFRTEAERADSVLASITAAVDRPGVLAAWAYGSFARGEDRHDSDIDIVVVIDSDEHGGIADAIRLHLSHDGDRLGFTPSVVAIAPSDVLRLSLGDPWWGKVEAEAIVIKGRRPAELADQVRRAS